jgi:hypothetical protein
MLVFMLTAFVITIYSTYVLRHKRIV